MKSRIGWSVFAAILLSLASGFSAVSPAQTPSQEKSAPIPKKKYDPSRRVPPYFGQIALSGEQRESIYKIRKTHIDKIEALKKEITKLETEMLTECEGVLTDTQKKLLENLRRSGTGAGAASTNTKTAEPTKTPK